MAEALTVLTVEDDPQMRRFLRATLEEHRHIVVECVRSQLVLDALWTSNPDIVLLDLDISDKTGLALLRELRPGTGLPIVVLSSGDLSQRAEILELGIADDCLPKPPVGRELLARLRAAANRSVRDAIRPSSAAARRIALGPIEVDPSSCLASIAGRIVTLTIAECRALAALIRAGGNTVKHHDLLVAVYGTSGRGLRHSSRKLVAALDHKLSSYSSEKYRIEWKPWSGYRISGWLEQNVNSETA